MKKYIKILLVLVILINATSCADNKVIDNNKYETYGILNKDQVRNDDIYYRVSVGNIILSAVFFATIVAPVYFISFSLFEPVCKIPEGYVKGTDPCN